MDTGLQKRKHPRLKEYDYSSPGAYFITICTYNKRCMLSYIVGQGLPPDETAVVKYTKCGMVAEKQLLALEERYEHLTVDMYVIMPNHIHAIFRLDQKTDESASRPALHDIVCSFKSLTARNCRPFFSADKLFQSSFYEHIIRSDDDYNSIAEYILTNPARWQYDKLYNEN